VDGKPPESVFLQSSLNEYHSMHRIGLLSDTHSSIHPRVFEFFKNCDEIWHAGDIGSTDVAEKLSQFKFLRAIYGNIDGTTLRDSFPEIQIFTVESVKVLMIHIGGYPGHYPPGIRNLLVSEKPKIFICGHSHILKVIYDDKYRVLHINPGAAGNSGLHKTITMVRFVIDGDQIKDLEVLDIPRKR
jgi:putative phosphoesterase